jgi:hypothetical protein
MKTDLALCVTKELGTLFIRNFDKILDYIEEYHTDEDGVLYYFERVDVDYAKEILEWFEECDAKDYLFVGSWDGFEPSYGDRKSQWGLRRETAVVIKFEIG